MTTQNIFGTFALDPQTIAFGTAITFICKPRQMARTKIEAARYNCGGANAHSIKKWSSLTRTTTVLASAGGSTTLTLKRDPGAYVALFASLGIPGTPLTADVPITGSSLIVVQLANGEFSLITVTSVVVNADLSVTLTIPALPNCGVNLGATVWYMGTIAGLTNPFTGVAPVAQVVNSATDVTLGWETGEWAVSKDTYDPILVTSNNVTSTGTFSGVQGRYEI